MEVENTGNELEIEVWKRAEENRYRAILAQRELDHLECVSREWEAKEGNRETQFSQLWKEMQTLETQARWKLSELTQREGKLASLEEETSQRISDITNQLQIKQEEHTSVKNRIAEEAANFTRMKKNLTGKINETKQELTRTENELIAFRKEAVDFTLQNELSAKNMQIMNQEQKLEQMERAKNMYLEQCRKFKAEIDRVRKLAEDERTAFENQQRDELARMKLEVASKKMMNDERSQLNEVKQALESLKPVFLGSTAAPEPVPMPAPQPVVENVMFEPMVKNTPYIAVNTEMAPLDELSRLRQERHNLVNVHGYTSTDLLIVELDRQIAALYN